MVDPDRPIAHVQGPRGWLNDPNAPIYYNGYYHIFWQALPHKAKWDFKIEVERK